MQELNTDPLPPLNGVVCQRLMNHEAAVVAHERETHDADGRGGVRIGELPWGGHGIPGNIQMIKYFFNIRKKYKYNENNNDQKSKDELILVRLLFPLVGY